ncbi:MAG: chlorophyllide a reductase iron protein subunit X [Rhizobacter sp.]|nr:chlorophyllide a reductase iron protein subunit X [Chlorobiales bacterium]
MSARTIAVYGKGGIGKSFFTTNLTATFAQMQKRVLQIGCDPKHDSTTSLFGGLSLPTVTEVFGEKTQTHEKIQLEDIVFKRRLDGFSQDIFGIEVGGPEVGRGCGGRGIISGFDVLEKLGLFSWDLDVVLMDFLGDVVCGGFATPLARSLCDEVILVVSNDRQSIFAANNICVANNYFKTVGGKTRLLGLVVNKDDGSGIAEHYAKEAGINIIMKLPYNSEARDKADGFDVAIRVDAFRKIFAELALKIWNNEIPYSEARGLKYDEFMNLFGEVDKRKPVSAMLGDLNLKTELNFDAAALQSEVFAKDAFIANGFSETMKPVQIEMPAAATMTNALGDKIAIGTSAGSLPEQDEFVVKEKHLEKLPLMAARQMAVKSASKAASEAKIEAVKKPMTEQELLMYCISLLPRVERDLITLFELKKKSLGEIAIEQQLDLNDAKVHLDAARKHLKELYFQTQA